MKEQAAHLRSVPEGLPVPLDDGAADHLRGMRLPDIELPSTQGGQISLARVRSRLIVVYCYPRTGRPETPIPAGWDDIPGARGCTPQNCAYRDRAAQLTRFEAALFGLSTQTTEYQREMAQRLGLTYPVLSDAEHRLTNALRLPTFEFEGERLIKRLSFVAVAGIIEHVEYPVFPSDSDAPKIVAWLEQRSGPATGEPQ
ncbi:MAG: peroxiredoxin [Candidatus Eremiobacteraeota bacterium]|nr:peroxiredoxin [Candidatus Eremiobacteraeota bacterium]MBV8281021.1 peroxiredoxin [Candidatus Eremiobacteraeota bacterium]